MSEVLPVISQSQPSLTIVRPIAKPAAMIEAHNELVTLITETFKEGIDYGTIPGTDKPTLYKPGAEKLLKAFGATARYKKVESEVDHDREVKWQKRKKVWSKTQRGVYNFQIEEGASLGLYRFIYKCEIQLPDGRVIGDCDGSGSTMESKYIDRPRDCENTVMKMAQKRALVGAALNAFGLSNRFTQDLEDTVDVQSVEEPKAPAQEQVSKSKQPENPPPSKAYTGEGEQQSILQAIMKKKGVPEEFWSEIHNRMIGKKSAELDKIIAEVGVENAF